MSERKRPWASIAGMGGPARPACCVAHQMGGVTGPAAVRFIPRAGLVTLRQTFVRCCQWRTLSNLPAEAIEPSPGRRWRALAGAGAPFAGWRPQGKITDGRAPPAGAYGLGQCPQGPGGLKPRPPGAPAATVLARGQKKAAGLGNEP